MGILNFVRTQGSEERECRRESEFLGPCGRFRVRSSGFIPLTNRNVIHFIVFVNSFVKIFFNFFQMTEKQPIFT